MRRSLRTLFLTVTAVAAAVALYLTLTLPPAAAVLDGRLPRTQVLGAYHVHTARSDGTGTVEEVAAAAARAGLSFVVLTDHGDGTGPPLPPSYRSGVLCLDAVEISTTGGHIVALGLTEPTPFPLAGRPRDVIDDIHRFGGTAVVAHPESPKPDLRWRGQNLDFDGIEWLNVDSEWRDDGAGRVLATAVRAFVRPPEAIATLFRRPTRAIQRWDNAAARRPVFGLAAVDAHASIPWRDGQEPRQQTALAWPTYSSLFRVAAQAVVLDEPLSGDPVVDARQILAALTTGRSFSIVRSFGEPASLTFLARSGTSEVGMGSRLEPTAPETTFEARIPQAPGARVTLFADGRPLESGHGSVSFTGPTRPGVYRIEATLLGHDAPWIASNPIVIGPPPVAPPAVIVEEGPARPIDTDTGSWRIENESASSGTLDREDDSLRLRYHLDGGPPRGQYVALVAPVALAEGVRRLHFTGRADRPMRISLQVRLPGGSGDRRWQRSVYLDETARRISVGLEEFEPVDAFTTQRPVVALVESLLFVIDTLNTATGANGTVWISDVSAETRVP